MKRFLFLVIVVIGAVSAVAQPKLDLGLKGGVNFSKISMNLDDYSSESITKSHIGAFGRVGWDRVFVQPELYFSGKGGDLTSSPSSTMASFDFKTFDVPVLLGVRIIKSKLLDLHVVGGPVFSNITKDEVSGGNLDDSFYSKHYMGVQYGVGIDVLFITVDARIENALGEFYVQGDNSAKNNAFMVSVGFKIL